jgi:hypothetical protein
MSNRVEQLPEVNEISDQEIFEAKKTSETLRKTEHKDL